MPARARPIRYEGNSYRTASHHTIAYHIASYHTVPYHTVPHPTMEAPHAVPYNAAQRRLPRARNPGSGLRPFLDSPFVWRQLTKTGRHLPAGLRALDSHTLGPRTPDQASVSKLEQNAF